MDQPLVAERAEVMRPWMGSFQVGGERFPGLSQIGPEIRSVIQRHRVKIYLWGDRCISIWHQHLAGLGIDV